MDSAKGAAILLVVVGHAWRGFSRRGLVPEELFVAVDSRIYAFHMPVFFALAGWFFIRSLTKSSLWDFTRNRFRRLFWPMILWTYLFLGTKVLSGELSNNPVALNELLILPVPGVLHFWFLWALLVISFAFAFLRPLVRDGQAPSSVLWIVGLCVAAAQFLTYPTEVAVWIGPAVQNSPFFFLGMVLGQTNWFSQLSTRSRVVGAAIFALVVGFWPVVVASGMITLGSLLLTLCFLIFFSGIKAFVGAPIARILSRLGIASMAIYLAHTIFSAALREALFVAGIRDLSLQMFLGTLIGVVGPLVLLDLARRTRTTAILGF